MKKTHEYKIGDIVRFKFFDGQTYVGQIKELTYMGVFTGTPNYHLPQYKIEVCDAKRTSYYTISDTYFKEVNGNLKVEHQPVTKITSGKSTLPTQPWISKYHSKRTKTSELDEAIKMQKEFMNHNIKKEYV